MPLISPTRSVRVAPSPASVPDAAGVDEMEVEDLDMPSEPRYGSTGSLKEKTRTLMHGDILGTSSSSDVGPKKWYASS